MGFNLLRLMAPLVNYVPQLQPPKGPISLQNKTIITAATLVVYLASCQIPLLGISRIEGADPLGWVRAILASSRGSLMELGISPIITAGWFMNLAGFFGVVQISKATTPKEMQAYAVFQKMLTLIMAFGQAIGTVTYGYYSHLGLFKQIAIVIQLVFATVMIMYVDDILSSGYGLGSGTSLFIAVNTAENIFWDMFSPVTLKSAYGMEFQGSFVNFVYLLWTKESKTMAVWIAFTRESAPNLASLFGTFFIFFIVIYLYGFKAYVPLIYQKSRGYLYRFPVRLFYTSTISIILQSLMLSHFYKISELLYSRFPKIFFVQLLGVWEGENIVSGLTWWISPPQDVAEWVQYPIRGVVYLIFVCLSSALFARLWVEIERETPRVIAKRLRDDLLTLQDYQNKSVYDQLNWMIPTATITGGIIVGLLTILGDLVNTTTSSTSLLLTVNTIYRFYDKLEGLNQQQVSLGFEYKPR